ncbi:hypothetical protein PYCCODRAFT_1358163 [Trametes coccinea BRFM310]|uniref:C3H1-type domain-containing protein n=1 Tax=Trametes coccinea (strain BRFM310) TaxID=1353009 RepID=A0A1Y2J5S2_TRAC3|nr:hypothetical protein PYCCODRAFT_1358163 [Trametes coccinea BRFM310]
MSDASGAPPGATQGSAAAAPESSQFNEEIVQACEAVVESFRRREISKAEAAARLFRALKLNEVVEAEELGEREQAYQSYFDMLEDYDRDLRAAAERSPGVASSSTHRNSGEAHAQDDEANVQERDDVGVESGNERTVNRNTRSLLERLSDSSPSKRNREALDEESDEESVQNDRRGRLKRTIDESLFPFVSSSAEDTPELSDDLQKTLVLKENYTRDLAVAKQRVVCSPGCPPVPDSVWLDVLANRFVDLDKIFSAVYAVDGDNKNSVKFGDFELSGLPSKPKKHIERHGHWTIAWALYQRAVLFVYPHREKELRTYYDQINGFFAAVSEHEAVRVVNLDRAIRGEVGRSNTLLLSDFSHFNHLYTMHVVGSGASAQSSTTAPPSSRRGTGVRRPGSSSEACIRFNEGRCSSRNCRYRHVCSLCSARDHVASSCTQKTSGGPNADRRK